VRLKQRLQHVARLTYRHIILARCPFMLYCLQHQAWTSYMFNNTRCAACQHDI